ncbi:alanyl-tRNA editing protein [Cochlodiniinecator piscidefendens]|uniref:alanyl-tRNA editing protein n=1 Tax=Cochlodiniinecator piscidefendens TaxID=2715756 RepID=UPI00140D91BB|nr:alanyl-tRNA editing protein [Cochlodiniinecator piscidefendens]
MTQLLFRDDAYLKDAPGVVLSITPEGGVVLDQTIFYAAGGGQPGDSGVLRWNGQSLTIATAIKNDDGDIVLIPGEAQALPEAGQTLTQSLDWDRRHRHMRVHTALHLLSVVVPLPVSGGSIAAEKGRLDFDMPEAPEDKAAIEDALNALIERDLTISEDWITEAELDANPDLVKTMSVKPPRGGGKIRLVRIGTEGEQIDLQPCGGTHVATTAEIGRVRIGKIEKKGKQNRRVYVHLLG